MAHSHGLHEVSRGRLVWTLLVNSAITAAEFIGGFISGYLALIADAVHNLSDVAALALAWMGARGSAMPATKKSTYGYKRIEVMTALISAAALVVIAIFIFFEAYDRWMNPTELTQPWVFFTVAVIGLLGNIFSVVILSPEKGKSLNMKTAFLHMLYDAVSSVAVIIGGIVILSTGWVWVDAFLSCVIAMMILWSSYLVIREAVWIFLEAVPPGLEFDTVMRAIGEISRVQGVHHLHIWSLSSRDVAMSCHVCLGETDYQDGPAVIAEISEMLCRRFSIDHCTIQLEKDDCAESGPPCTPGRDSEDA
ncbi:MAG: cation transporter [Candidatus Zixiibacteriota bacterium]|nr:MAG: cation transporter [candidate division Zixibacteria bacterium]